MAIKVLGVDPGKTTGICVVEMEKNYGHSPVFWQQLKLDELAQFLKGIIDYYRNQIKMVAVESVVMSGILNKDKFEQIRAFDRSIYIVTQEFYADDIKPKVVTIAPESRKAARVRVPKEVKGVHAKDAYRVAVSARLMEVHKK